MPFTSIFFNATLRGSVLQFLLFSLIFPVNLAITFYGVGQASFESLILTISVASFILVHHVASLFVSRLSWVIIVDWLLLALEVAGVGFIIFRSMFGEILFILGLPTLVASVCMLSFRTATILASPNRVWKQKLEFWGGCRATHRSSWMVLLNRPLGKPLVRGESTFAIIVRCVILALIGVGFPVLAANRAFFQPTHANVYSRVIAWEYSDGNLSIPQFENTGNAVVLVPQPALGFTTSM
ncbi:hypothetical protein C8R46DRAFT_1057087, partial [Mycena filopes]